MLTVDHQTYGPEAFRDRWERMFQREEMRNPEGKRYAFCLKHAFDVVAAVLYLKERGGSVLLMHDSTPFETAVEVAGRADCSYLLYHRWDDCHRLEGASRYDVPALLQYSSGTTRAPTLIARGWGLVDEEVSCYNRFFQTSLARQPIILVPVSHSFGLITGVLASIGRGEHPIVIQDKNPKVALNIIHNTPEHQMYTVPFLFRLLDSLNREKKPYNRVVISGAPPSDPLLQVMKLRTNELWQQYGCTEAGCISLSQEPIDATDVGVPLGHYQVSIEPLEASDSNPLSQGEIIVRSDALRIATGDLGYIEPLSGRLHVRGRLDDLINVSGLKVIPSEVESVMARMPGVHECLVLKSSHPVHGEAVRALVVAEPQVEGKDIRSWCIQHLPSYKVPGNIELVNEIPRTPAGKISRKYIHEMER